MMDTRPMRRGKDRLFARSAVRGAPRGVRPAFSVFAAMLALLLQVFAVQTHIDGVAGAGARAIVTTALGQAVQHEVAAPPSEPQAACPLCQALASGATPLAASSATLAMAFAAIASEAPCIARLAPAAPAHPWQSRAPPAFL
jgi:hypothetical protein